MWASALPMYDAQSIKLHIRAFEYDMPGERKFTQEIRSMAIRNVHWVSKVLKNVRAGREATSPLEEVEARLGLAVAGRKRTGRPPQEQLRRRKTVAAISTSASIVTT